MQFPDIIYDTIDVVNNPKSSKDWTHLLLDFGGALSYTTPNEIAKLLFELPGAIDDGYNAVTGRDVLEDIANSLQHIPINKRSIKRDNYIAPTDAIKQYIPKHTKSISKIKKK